MYNEQNIKKRLKQIDSAVNWKQVAKDLKMRYGTVREYVNSKGKFLATYVAIEKTANAQIESLNKVA